MDSGYSCYSSTSGMTMKTTSQLDNSTITQSRQLSNKNMKKNYNFINFKTFNSDAGFTMVEVLVAVAVVAMVMTAVVSGVSFSIKNTRYARDKSLAIHYAQESLEWLRKQRDENGWNVFSGDLDADGAQIVYCLPTLPDTYAGFVALTNSVCQTTDVVGGNTIYIREMTLIKNAADLSVEVSVTWDEGGDTKEVVQRTTLRDWQN